MLLCPMNPQELLRTTPYTCIMLYYNVPQREKICLRGIANNTGTDQPVHPRSLISAFVIRFLESNK